MSAVACRRSLAGACRRHPHVQVGRGRRRLEGRLPSCSSLKTGVAPTASPSVAGPGFSTGAVLLAGVVLFRRWRRKRAVSFIRRRLASHPVEQLGERPVRRRAARRYPEVAGCRRLARIGILAQIRTYVVLSRDVAAACRCSRLVCLAIPQAVEGQPVPRPLDLRRSTSGLADLQEAVRVVTALLRG